MGPTIIFFGQALGDVATAVKGGDQFIAIPEFLVDGLDCGKRAKIPSVLRMPGVMIFVNAVGSTLAWILSWSGMVACHSRNSFFAISTCSVEITLGTMA